MERAQKRSERFWIRYAWRTLPHVFPRGVLKHARPPAPDVEIHHPDDVLGVEVTQIYAATKVERSNHRQIEAMQKRVVANAQATFAAARGESIFVNVTFAPVPLSNADDMTRELLDVITAHLPAEGRSSEWRLPQAGTRKRFPDWLRSVSIFHYHIHSSDWIGTSGWGAEEAEYDQIRNVIARKQRNLANYRVTTAAVWLLIVLDELSTNEDIVLPAESDGWQFAHDFDRLVLMTRERALIF